MTVQKLSFGGKFKLIGFSGQTRRRERVREGPSKCSYSPHFGIVTVGWKFTKVQRSAIFVCFKRILGLDLNIFLYTISKKYISPLWIQRRVFEKKINGHQPQQRASMFQMDYCIDVQKRIAGKRSPISSGGCCCCGGGLRLHKTASVLCGRKHLLVVLLLNFLVKVSSIIIKFT